MHPQKNENTIKGLRTQVLGNRDEILNNQNEIIDLELQIKELKGVLAAIESFPEVRAYLSARQEFLYVTYLTFLDPTSGSSLKQTEVGEFLKEAVLEGIALAQRRNKNLKYNESGFLIEDTAQNVNQLVNTIFDPNLSQSEKVGKIINEMMIPNNVDVIVTGQYIDKGPTVDVRPFIVTQRDDKISVKIATYSKQDFLCSDPNSTSRQVLCQGAFDEIANLVKELLEQL